MKKLVLALAAIITIGAVVAPAYAETTLINCVFKDKSLCVVESLSPTSGD